MTLRLRDVLTLPSCVAFKLWSLSGSLAPVPVTLLSGTRALIRPASSDFDVFYEVFVKRVYDPPPSLDRDSVRVIVDLGANVGFSNLFWLEIFPRASVLTFEPHPGHVELARRNLHLNGAEGRVTVHAAAAGTANTDALLNNHGSESAVVTALVENAIPIRVVDFFNALPAQPIDLLKIDIEGGEYALAADARFQKLRPRAICMEAHPHSDWAKTAAEAESFWADYWRTAGYRVSLRKGILWGLRS